VWQSEEEGSDTKGPRQAVIDLQTDSSWFESAGGAKKMSYTTCKSHVVSAA
jgi:hypothetical protein